MSTYNLPRRPRKRVEVQLYSFFQPRRLMAVGGQRHDPTSLPLGKTGYPLYRRLFGPRDRSGRVRKISPPPGFVSRTVHPQRVSIPTELSWPTHTHTHTHAHICIYIYNTDINRLTPKDPYSGRTAPLTSKRCILYIYSTNTDTGYFKHGIYSPFSSLQNAVCFIILTYLVPGLLTFYVQVC